MSIKNNTIVENEDFVSRLVDVCKTNEPAELSRLLGISYQGAKNYLEGRLPDAKVLVTIVEKTQCSLNWLLTGKGEKSLKPSKLGFNEVFDSKLKESIQELLIRGAVTVQDVDEDSQQAEYVVLEESFSPTAGEILELIATRIEDAFEYRKSIGLGENALETSPLYREIIAGIRQGIFPEHFGTRLHGWKLLTRHNVQWFLYGTGEKIFNADKKIKSADDDSLPDKVLAAKFLEEIEETIRRDKINEEKRRKIVEKFELRQLIREIVQEELAKQRKSGAPSFSVSGTVNEDKRKTA